MAKQESITKLNNIKDLNITVDRGAFKIVLEVFSYKEKKSNTHKVHS